MNGLYEKSWSSHNQNECSLKLSFPICWSPFLRLLLLLLGFKLLLVALWDGMALASRHLNNYCTLQDRLSSPRHMCVPFLHLTCVCVSYNWSCFVIIINTYSGGMPLFSTHFWPRLHWPMTLSKKHVADASLLRRSRWSCISPLQQSSSKREVSDKSASALVKHMA